VGGFDGARLGPTLKLGSALGAELPEGLVSCASTTSEIPTSKETIAIENFMIV
jgi:hypothetical protein